MPDVDKIIDALQQATESLGRAASAAARADVGAQRVQSRAATNRFRGIAAGMGAVRDRLTRIQQMLAEVAATVTSTAGEVQRVTDDMSPEDVVSTLDPAAKKIGATSTSASAILSELDGLKGEIAKTLKGGQPRPLMALADQMKNALVQVSGYLGAAKQRTDETIAEARQAGNF